MKITTIKNAYTISLLFLGVFFIGMAFTHKADYLFAPTLIFTLFISFIYIVALNRMSKNDSQKLASLEKVAQLKKWSFNRESGMFHWGLESFEFKNWKESSNWTSLFGADFAFVLSQLLQEDKLIIKGIELLVRESKERGEAWFQLNGTFRGESKNYIEGYAKNVSALYDAQIALRTREENLDLALESGNLATWEWQLDSAIDNKVSHFWIDPIAKSLLGFYSDFEIIESWRDFVPLNEQRQVLKFFVFLKRTKNKGEDKGHVFSFCNNDGVKTFLKIRGRIAERNRDGGVKRIVGIVQDISEQKKGEQAIADLAENYKYLWDSNILGLLIHKKGVIKNINKTLLELLGWDLEEAIGVNLLDMINEDEKDKAILHLNLNKNIFQCDMKSRYNNLIPVEAVGKDIKLGGEDLRFVMVQDISRRKQAELDLLNSRAELQGILEGMQDLILMVDPLGDIIDLAPSQGQKEYTQALSWIGQNFSSFTQISLEDFISKLDEVRGGLKNCKIEFSTFLNGEEHYFRGSLNKLSDEIVIVVCSEQTAIRKALESVKESQARFKGLSDLAEEMVIFHQGDLITDANDSTQRNFRLSENELLNKKISDLVGLEDYQALMEHIENNNSEKHIEITGVRDGVEFPIQAMTKIIDRDTKKGVIILNDITERKRIEEKLKHMATYDALTQLPNRVLFNDRLHRAILQAERSKHRVCVFLLDLDGFKEVNDTKGHQAGDELLIKVAKLLEQNVRKNDTVARMGGDEFAFVLPGINEDENAIILANKIIEKISEPILTTCGKVKVSGSIGIAFYPDHGKDLDTVYKAADLAMYKSKSAGKSQATLYKEDDRIQV